MTLNILVRLAGTMVVALALSGCMDITMDVELTSETTAVATMTQVMSDQVYPLLKANQQEGTPEESGTNFCAMGILTENLDNTATCVIARKGAFADLTFDEDGGKETVRYSAAGPGLVRVAFNTKDMAGDITADNREQMNKEAMDMVESYFVGHFVTLTVRGGEITKTNMTLADDKLSASSKIDFVALFNGTADLPDELYAIVKVSAVP